MTHQAEAAPTSPASGGGLGAYPVLRWLVLATFVVILNETLMINAIPRLMTEFAVSARAAQWLSTAFMLTMAVVIPVTGWFLQRVTTRVAFRTAMTVFSTGTLIAVVAPGFPVLVGARVVQAAGTAVMIPLLMTTLLSVVPEHDRGRVMGNVTLAISVAPALGPAISGVVLQYLSWRWMFGIVLPIAIGIAVLALRRLESVGVTRPGTIDWFSVALAAFGFGGLVFGLSRIGAADPGAVPPGLVIGVATLGIVVFVARQLWLQRTSTPLLDLRTLLHRSYTVCLVLMGLAFMAMLGSMVLLPLYLQNVRGLSVLSTGLLVMPGGVVMGLLGPRVGRWYDRLGARPLVIPGAVGIVAALGLLTRVDATTPVWLILAIHLVLMVSLALVFTPAFTLGLGALPMTLYSHGSSLLGTVQQVAAAIGTAAVVTVMSSRAADLARAGEAPVSALVGGLQWAFALGAGLSVVVLGVALALPRRRARTGADDASRPGGVGDDDTALVGSAAEA